MEVAFKTDAGLRRSNNEDAYFIMLNEKVYIIADGVGGNNSGEIASTMAVKKVASEIKSRLIPEGASSESIKIYLEECAKNANIEVISAALSSAKNNGMATTMVIGCIRNNVAYFLNIGDSRAYVYKNKILKQITEDHTYVNTLVKAGAITEAEAKVHQDKHMITRAIGAEYDVETDFFTVKIDEECVFLLCTDGLYDEVEDDTIKQVLDKDLTMADTCDELVDLAKAHGGRDNITIICIKVTEEDINE